MNLFNRLRVRYLITLVVGLALTIGLVAVAILAERHQEASMRALHEKTMEKLTEGVLQGLQSVMLAGSANIAQDFAERLKSVPEISDMRILRIGGQEAFLDNKTVEEVNERRGDDIFDRHDNERVVQVLPPTDPSLARVLESAQPLALYRPDANGNPTLTFLAPINNQENCYKCHGRAKPVRGVLLLSTSLAELERDILKNRQQTLVMLAVSLMAAMLLTGYLMGRTVVAPLEAVMKAIARVRAGDLEHKIAWDSDDELGRMAESFNVMTADLKTTYSGLQAERDKLTTIILGAAEGIAVADRSGKVALVNPAMEQMTGKSAQQIIDEGLERLLDDPASMTTWLAGGGQQGTPTVTYRNHSFQVYAASLTSDDGRHAGAAVLLRDVTEERRLEAELRRLSTTDALTGLFNRRHLDDTLRKEFNRAARDEAGPLSVIMSDVDHFKKFNDTHGHDQGDRVLKAVAQAMRDSIRQFDVPCRYGGEEFFMILPRTGTEGAVCVAERLRLAVESMVVDGLKVTISLGVATYPNQGAEGPDNLVEQADAALYRAKEGGRNRVMTAGAAT
jgi:diguanylate cyclase (GGDEF)-like protein/PAS domain S-box-containing protein